MISIDHAKEMIENSRVDGADLDAKSVGALLSWIDVERVLESDDDRKNAARNLLIFKLHYIDGFAAPELAAFPVFSLSVSGIEAVLNRMRRKLR